jgi:predicted Ser/Thr protein kinase
MNEEQSNPMMEQKCPQCGAPLPSGVLAGLCPACLMKQGAAADTGAGPENAPFQPPGVAEVARMFPQLEIIAFIGKGGMGAVYQARQPGLDRMVALKILPPQVAAGPGFVERFNREARALARLSHPNIVAVHEFGQVNGLPYFIMEFVDGLNLRELERAGKLSPSEALQIVPQICEALQFAHDEGIVHRDIKPENILVDKKGRVKIADFGIAKILSGGPDVDLTSTKGAIGTPHYMAPEQMEKPTTVDHRADIFSLGVVFYEMLTGELPLGKFGPPSSRKIEVDVRLDDVVLRALEKDPERRYQHASQVKTAVDTIAGSAAPPPSPGADAAALAREILARDYALNIRSCIRRGWRLVMGNFWVFVGVTALVMALLGMASSIGGSWIHIHTDGGSSAESSAVATIVWGPLMGGLWLYFLKRIRREPATVETAFCGFSPRFLQLFLAGFVTSLLTWLGFLCLILPGIYLLIAWGFALPLVADKQLDFWSAMELSRKVISRHWFKFLGFGIVLFLLMLCGVLALIVGTFVILPVVLAAQMYAYEDIFGGVTGAAAPAGTGPGGTVVMPCAAPQPARAGAGPWNLATKIGLAAAVLVIIGFLLVLLAGPHKPLGQLLRHLDPFRARAVAVTPLPAAGKSGSSFAMTVKQLPLAPVAAPAPAIPPAAALPPAPEAPTEADKPAPAPAVVFGPVVERDLTNFEAIRLDSGQTGVLPPFVTERRGVERDSAACAWLEGAGMDLASAGESGDLYSMVRDMVTLPRARWADATPDSVAALLHDLGRNLGTRFGDDGRTNTFGFKTRDGVIGLLQITASSKSPSVVSIRYKLFPANEVSGGTPQRARESLAERMEAAEKITDLDHRGKAMVRIAGEAAASGEVEVVKQALLWIQDLDLRNAAAHQAALALAQRNLGREAIEIADGISDLDLRNQTMSQLAQ